MKQRPSEVPHVLMSGWPFHDLHRNPLAEEPPLPVLIRLHELRDGCVLGTPVEGAGSIMASEGTPRVMAARKKQLN